MVHEGVLDHFDMDCVDPVEFWDLFVMDVVLVTVVGSGIILV